MHILKVKMNLYENILIWLLSWLFTYTLIYFGKSKKINYIINYGLMSFIFLIASIINFITFKILIFDYFKNFMILPFIILALFFILNTLVYYLSSKYMNKPIKLIKKYPNEFFLLMNYKYLTSKSFDILFQQTMILILILLLIKNNFYILEIIFLFAILFGGIHIFQYIRSGKFFGTYYLIFSILSSFIFPLIIIKLNYGVIYTYIIHWLFYTLSALYFWYYNNKKYNIL